MVELSYQRFSKIIILCKIFGGIILDGYKNSYNRLHYDRISLMVPKGNKEKIKEQANRYRMSVNEYIWSVLFKDMNSSENLNVLDISNRRYVGSKRSLVPFIRSSLKNIRFGSFADLFAGTGVVAAAYNGSKRVITNDNLYSNFICHFAWFSDGQYDEKKLREVLVYYNSLSVTEENYVTETYGNRYFSSENASKIGFIREDIERLKGNREVNEREYALLVMSLLYAVQQADVSRTVGHYMTYLKNPKEDGKLQLRLPLAPLPDTNSGNLCYNMDALELVSVMPPVDVLYLDPPYHRQYGEYYHVLENIARWEKAEAFGETRRICTPKSSFSIKSTALSALERIVQCGKAKYIVVSYNNDSANNISNIEMMDLLSAYGSTRVLTEDYPAFHGAKHIADNRERLFLCKVKL